MFLNNKLAYLLMVLLLAVSCSKVKQKTKETINEGGEIVGKAATEFAEGITEGAERTLDCKINLSKPLIAKGLKTGNFYITNDSLGGLNNVLRLYIIFEKDYKSTVTAKVIAKNGLESGRTKLIIAGLAGDAKYFDFKFDSKTNIEVKSEIGIE